ncbi:MULTISPECIES: TetR/AcrR family transcriptional regulator [unclassified Limnobacter]|jgi:AcrR family transcriptional regulator|uniref:TetR/AcrR family transcriptional regulator n=1 Tax=unclassified Limnobacter TaxID=2630203 RepID=UPI000156C25C|nr:MULTISPECIES: TetR/AcrR family transcriptional regulator [unclassified Limnobacter]EDM82466.1 Possible Transcriptional Regulator, TetR family protein [Limnobacter sp. MED105]MAZ11134.1 TetR/AcrR family transcriptional regulator [Sutterellaceae bacterium]|tara:strand:+ start:2448 stop:3047 length:600 start_codon:yes stop_codon:yes gene_type:complete
MNQDLKAPGSKAELRRQQILDAAAECFRKSGFHGASMSEIAKSFGMSAGHIYNYFESKEAIIEAMVKRDLDQALERIAKIQGEKDILKAMLGTVDEGVQRRIDRSELDTEILAEAARNPKVAATVQGTDTVIREKVTQLIKGIQPLKNSTPCELNLAAKSTILMALFDGLQIRAIRDPNMKADDIARVLKSVIQQMLQS